MKAAICVLFLTLPLAVVASEVRLGDSASEVRAALGAPRGQLKVGERQVLIYDRGDVELRGGAVTRVALVSEADFAVLEARRAAAAARASEENARLNVQGEALKARKLADAAFLSAPLSYQISFWHGFSQRYPGVSVTEELAVDRMRLAEQINIQRATEERLAELESRVDAAEARADEAEAGARQFASYVSSDYGYGYGYGGYRGHHNASLEPIQYTFFPSPVPYATSPYPNRGSTPSRSNPPTYHNVATSTGSCSSDQRSSGRHGRM